MPCESREASDTRSAVAIAAVVFTPLFPLAWRTPFALSPRALNGHCFKSVTGQVFNQSAVCMFICDIPQLPPFILPTDFLR